MRPYGASCGITLQRQLLRSVVVLQNRTGGGQGAHAVARGIVQLKALGQRDAGDFGILFQRHNADTGGVAGRLFGYECAADELVVKIASSVSSGRWRMKASSALSL